MRVTIMCDGYLFWYICVYKSLKDAACMTTVFVLYKKLICNEVL